MLLLSTEMVYSVPLHPSHVTSVSDGRWVNESETLNLYLVVVCVTNSGLSRGQQCPALWTSGSAPPPSTPSTSWLLRYDVLWCLSQSQSRIKNWLWPITARLWWELRGHPEDKSQLRGRHWVGDRGSAASTNADFRIKWQRGKRIGSYE